MGHLAAQGGEADVLDVDPGEENLAAFGQVVPLQEGKDRAFATAGLAHECRDRAAGKLE